MSIKEKVVRTACSGCSKCCGILAYVKNGVLEKIEPAEFPERGWRHICLRGFSTVKIVNHPDRLQYPLKRVGERGEGKWQRMSWDEALDTIATQFKRIGEKYGYESIAMPSGTGGYMALTSFSLHRLISALGTTWVNIIGFGDSAGICGDKISYGTEGFEGAQHTTAFETPSLCVMWANNAAITHAIHWRKIVKAKEAGAKLIVVDPRFSTTAAKADEYISVRPGTDTALILGMIKFIWEQGLADEIFITKHTVGPLLVRADNGLFLRERDIVPHGADRYMVWDKKTGSPRVADAGGVAPALTGSYTITGIKCLPAFQLLLDMVGQYSMENTADLTGVPVEIIKNFATDYATMKPVASYRGLGLQRTFYGDITFRAVVALAAVTGNVTLQRSRSFKLPLEPLTNIPGREMKGMPLLQMYDTIETEQPHPIKALWIAKHNLLNQDPNRNRIVEKLLPKVEFMVAVDLFMTDTAKYADVVLPACSFYERPDLILPAHLPYIQLQQQVLEPMYESKSDFNIISELGRKMGFGKYFNRSAEEFLALLLASSQLPEKVTLDTLRQNPYLATGEKITGFLTPSGRIEFYSERMREFNQELPVYMEPLESNRRPLAKKYPLTGIFAHFAYQYHSRFIKVPWLREFEPEPAIEMNPADAGKRGIRDGDMVTAFNDRGRTRLKARVHEGLKAGVVNIKQGWWQEDYIDGSHHQMLTQGVINPAQTAVFQPNAAINDFAVEVTKVTDE
ncbi:molybdopterin-dependent oxidoreductase [Chloroflexota bacterium]